ncbi:SET domain-containing protein [Peniophora sp. CONT]|nr:SET domain-containing protein [Peniophora sp. CONT]
MARFATSVVARPVNAAASSSRLPSTAASRIPPPHTRQIAQPTAPKRAMLAAPPPVLAGPMALPRSLSHSDVFGPTIARNEEQALTRECKDRVGDALKSGRDPLDAGSIYPTEEAALGSYYLFYSGVRQNLPEIKPLQDVLPITDQAPRTRVVDIPGQGKGVLASRSFQTGELVVAERPLLVQPAVDMSLNLSARNGGSQTVNMRNWCLTQLVREKVRPQDRAAMQALHNAHSTDPADFAGIFDTNALTIPRLPGHNAPYGALCAHLARINHSCTPNTYWRWDTRTYAVHLYAARPIAEGEQLSIPYVPLLAPQAKRADQLLDRYIFRCTCPSCTGSRAVRAASDARRASLKTFVDTAHTHAEGALNATSSKTVAQAAEDAQAEQYFFADVWSPIFRYATRAALALGDAQSAAMWAKRAAKLTRVVTGSDGGWMSVAMSPQSMPGWGRMSAPGSDAVGLSSVIEAMQDLQF